MSKNIVTDAIPPPIPAHILRGQQTRRRVLEHAVQVATNEGLDALTIGRVALASGLTKAGLLGHFRSKEELQLATLDAGRNVFIQAVVLPALQKPGGAERLGSVLGGWIDYVAVCEGGCFFASVAAEFDARPGPVRDRVAATLQEWLAALERIIREAQQCGHLRAEAQPGQMAFELHGHEMSLNLQRQLFGSSTSVERARVAMRTTVLSQATDAGRQAFARGWRDEAAGN